MKGQAVALIAPIFLVLVSAEILAAGGSRHFGHFRSGHLAGSFRQSGRFHTSFGRHGLHLTPGNRHVPRHPFAHRKHFRQKVFGRIIILAIITSSFTALDSIAASSLVIGLSTFALPLWSSGPIPGELAITLCHPLHAS